MMKFLWTLFPGLIAALIIGMYVISQYGFTHFEASVMALLSWIIVVQIMDAISENKEAEVKNAKRTD